MNCVLMGKHRSTHSTTYVVKLKKLKILVAQLCPIVSRPFTQHASTRSPSGSPTQSQALLTTIIPVIPPLSSSPLSPPSFMWRWSADHRHINEGKSLLLRICWCRSQGMGVAVCRRVPQCSLPRPFGSTGEALVHGARSLPGRS